MLNKVESQVTMQAFELYVELNDEFLLRELALRLVKEMPISELNKLIKFKKTDPNDPATIDKMNDVKTTSVERSRLRRLYDNQSILYEAEVYLPDHANIHDQ